MNKGGYLKRFRKYGVDPRSLKWQNKKAAEQRYSEIVSLAELEGRSILDVGCGFGDIIPFLALKSQNFSYTGVDAIAAFIKEAKKLYPGYRFFTRDYFTRPLKEKFDIVVANGCLNANVADNVGFRQKAIATMYEYTREKLIFNMAGGSPQPKTSVRSNIWFADAGQIEKFCRGIAPRVTLIKHPGRRELTILMKR